ncbi:MAG: CARDB domain-containing protein [Candidatus Woesearchaeota archaeon]
MKKTFIFGLVLLLAIGIIGCSEESTVISPQSEDGSGDESGSAEDAGSQSADEGGEDDLSEDKNQGIDLHLKKISWSTIYPGSGEEVEVKLIIDNTGEKPVESFDYKIKITKDGTLWEEETKTYSKSLSPGSTVKIEEEYVFTGAGEYEVEGHIDPENKLNEAERLNNVQLTDHKATVREGSGTGSESTSSASSDSSSEGDCVDTDGGIDESVKGQCDDGVTTFGINDYCSDSTTLVEFSCGDDNECLTQEITCDQGCHEGTCI